MGRERAILLAAILVALVAVALWRPALKLLEARGRAAAEQAVDDLFAASDEVVVYHIRLARVGQLEQAFVDLPAGEMSPTAIADRFPDGKLFRVRDQDSLAALRETMRLDPRMPLNRIRCRCSFAYSFEFRAGGEQIARVGYAAGDPHWDRVPDSPWIRHPTKRQVSDLMKWIEQHAGMDVEAFKEQVERDIYARIDADERRPQEEPLAR